MIQKDTSPEYMRIKGEEKAKGIAEGTGISSSCIMWFYDTFYKRLFDVHPTCR